jgi:hypothetical protein
MRRSYYTRSAMHPALTGAFLAAAGIAAVAVIRSRRHAAESDEGLDPRWSVETRTVEFAGID